MKIAFWLLDINYEVRENGPEIWLWGVDEKGHRVLIIDRNFLPYFDLVLDKEHDSKSVITTINSKSTGEFADVKKLEEMKHTFFGKPVDAVRVFCRSPDDTTRYAKAMEKIAGVKQALEDEIRYPVHYLIDNQVSPCSWHEIEVEETKNLLNAQVDISCLAKTPPKLIEKVEVPKLRILGFSTIPYSKKGAPRPEINPVIIITATTNTGTEKQFVARNSSDKQVIKEFTEYVREFDPDILVGYGTNRQDWTYLIKRCKKLGVKLLVDRANTEPHMSVYGHVSVTGRVNVDFFDFSDELQEVKVKTLENIADFLGIMKLEKRIIIEDIDVPSYWEDNKKRPNLLQFSKENTQSIMGISDSMLDFAMQLSSLVGMPLDHVGTAAVGFRIESYLMCKAHGIGELIPKRVERPYIPYSGAVVLAPTPGLHENVTSLDFKSMYPSIMIAYNVSPDTYVPLGEPEPEGGVNIAPEVKHRFRKEPPGFYKEVLSSLIASRDKIKPSLMRLSPNSREYKVLDSRQKAVKVITNAAYGYTGWIGARWYAKPVAEAATAWGRQTILSTVDVAKKIGLEVVYSDTDSVFVKNDLEGIEKLSGKVGKELGLEIKPDKTYVRILFTEAKKKYCGLLPEGRLDVVGLEVVRGDWAACAKNVQEKVLEIILGKQAPTEAVACVRRYIQDLRQRKVPYRDLVIWKTLTKKVEEYEVKAPHVEAAKLLLKEGWEPSVGDKVGYVITVGSGKLYEKAKPYFLTTYDKVDLEYYVTNQVVPAVSRILAIFNVNEDELFSPARIEKTKTLEEFKM
jgi:DNA polymerase I